MNNMNYAVVRPFPGLTVGDTLSAGDFIDSRRMQQLVEQRYITPVMSLDAGKAQPTSQQLVDTPILELMQTLEMVSDACVIEAAIEKETRTTAVTYMKRRLNNANSNH